MTDTGGLGLEQFAADLRQQVISRCEIEGEEAFKENVFTQLMIEFLGDVGELDDAELCSHRVPGLQVNGYALSENEESLDLIVTVYTNDVPPKTVPRDETLAAFKRLGKFMEKALNGYHHQVDESTSVFDLAQRVSEIRRSVTRVQFFLLTDGIVKVDPPKDKDLAHVRASYQIWDIERFYRAWSSGREREAIEIDFEAAVGGAIPCLSQNETNPDYATFLAIFPGKAIVELYGRYGPRLLERNVRSFLQSRGSINRGIRNTIKGEPHMFLAFNNGLSLTAEAVDIVDFPEGGKGIQRVRDLQIVNGGQTTASIYHAAKKDGADVSGIYVQAKLTVLKDSSRMDEVVPKISAYANSQNKIQAADLEANNALHRRIEELSRTIWAPVKDGTQRQTRWYYERARGSYQDDLARERTPARQRAFMEIHPKAQLFGKTDLTKFVTTWAQLPHVVSRGAQSCFSTFTTQLEAHVKFEGAVDQKYFERLIAKAILFRTAESIMRKCGYAGYRANLVTYTLARLAHDTKGRIDLNRIWRDQALTPALEEAIAEFSRHVWDHIIHPPGSGNVTQYCKKEDCWASFLAKDIPLPRSLYEEIAPPLAQAAPSSILEAVPGPVNVKRECVAKVMAIPADTWFEVAAWARDRGQLNEIQRSLVCDIAVQVGYGKEPAPRKAQDALNILEAAERLGFRR